MINISVLRGFTFSGNPSRDTKAVKFSEALDTRKKKITEYTHLYFDVLIWKGKNIFTHFVKKSM
jgi:hypothetical protein